MLPALPRKTLRGASASIQRLVRLVRLHAERACCSGARRRVLRRARRAQVGTSKRLYAAAVALCRRQYADSGIVALCSLRSQLLLALSDAGAQQGAGPGSAYKELCEPDRCHRLALLLEGCVKDGHCEPKRLRDALGIMESLEKDAAASAAKAQKQSGKLGGRGAAQRAGSEASDGEP